ncbi:hypothetical protein DBR11_13555 [Pedobacter sp. HMWF019]|uniref:S41 family peptidase n=1 Tax=Pedobacter sp. HMWF019 TaxID=2056856 RepID=UPI000D3CD698|nr:S41 family peptidase [Pedobacter sp. HMWF019]PTS99032.1 hypothetical protein DBR11_13555 [Pedobacter sp. HMWF019]
MINFKSITTACILLTFLSVNAQQNLEKRLKNTAWLQEGYGRCLKIDDSTYTYYNINNIDCKTLVDGKLSGRFRVVSMNRNKLVLNPGGIVNYSFNKVASVPPKCTRISPNRASYDDNFRVFWETFNNNYAFFQERNVNWEQVYTEYLPRVRKLNSQKEFADILIEIVKKIGDGHIRLEIPDSLKTRISRTTPVTKPKRTTTDIIADIKKKYLVNAHTYNNGVIAWGELRNAKIAYILIKDMNNFSNYISPSEGYQPNFAKNYDKIKATREPLVQFEDEYKGVDKVMEKILSDIGKSDSVVIDLRFNGGGLETVALRLLSYFVNESKHVLSVAAKSTKGKTTKQEYTLQSAGHATYTGKVYLLLGPGTASAAEIFALAAHSYKNITTIGSRTAGIFSEILWKELPNGWEFSLSNEIYTDPSGKTYEGTGIPVNYELYYPRNRSEFNNSFYSGGSFTDSALDRIYNK